MSFTTFWNFINELAKKPLPPQMDRSMMDSKSGTDQANLTAALKGFGLIQDDLTVEPLLTRLVTGDEDQRKQIMREVVERYYPEPLKVSANSGTEKMLHDAFRDAYGMDAADTRRKSITFFLHAARLAGIELSANFPQTRNPGSATTTRVKRVAKRRNANDSAAAAPATPQQPAVKGDSYAVTLRGGGTVTLIIAESHFMLSKNREDRNFVNSLVDAMIDYAQGSDQEVVENEGGEP
jgi:hypothetical protein